MATSEKPLWKHRVRDIHMAGPRLRGVSYAASLVGSRTAFGFKEGGVFALNCSGAAACTGSAGSGYCIVPTPADLPSRRAFFIAVDRRNS